MRNALGFFIAAVAVAGLLVGNTAQASTHPSHAAVKSPTTTQYYFMYHRTTTGQYDGYCLDDPANGGNGTLQQVWACHYVVQEYWTFETSPYGAGNYQLVLWNGKCLDDPGDSSQAGTRIQVWTCLGNVNQAWYPIDHYASNGTFLFQEWINPGNGDCLDLRNDATIDGGIVQIWPCLQNNSQAWLLNLG